MAHRPLTRTPSSLRTAAPAGAAMPAVGAAGLAQTSFAPRSLMYPAETLPPVPIMAHQPADPSAVATVSIACIISMGVRFLAADCARHAEAEDPCLAQGLREVGRHAARLFDVLPPCANGREEGCERCR